LLDLDQFIEEETAYHVLANGDMINKSDYDKFGRQLVLKYPCLEFTGKKDLIGMTCIAVNWI